VGELAGAKAKRLTVIVCFHEPPFSVGPHGDNFEVQRTLHPLFVRYHVPLVFCGHDHLYYHTKRDGVVYVVTGGGGAPLYPPVNTQYGIPGDVYKTTYHIVRCVATGGSIQCTAITPDNQVIDRFTVATGRS
jgi:3',5'-cyclic AMP phosphodiesterase CpdA